MATLSAGGDHSLAKTKEADLTHDQWVLIIAHHSAIIPLDD